MTTAYKTTNDDNRLQVGPPPCERYDGDEKNQFLRVVRFTEHTWLNFLSAHTGSFWSVDKNRKMNNHIFYDEFGFTIVRELVQKFFRKLLKNNI